MGNGGGRKRVSWIVISLSAILVIGAIVYMNFRQNGTNREEVHEAGSITIYWAQWPPAEYLQKLCSEFTNETGIMVDIVFEPIISGRKLFLMKWR